MPPSVTCLEEMLCLLLDVIAAFRCLFPMQAPEQVVSPSPPPPNFLTSIPPPSLPLSLPLSFSPSFSPSLPLSLSPSLPPSLPFSSRFSSLPLFLPLSYIHTCTHTNFHPLSILHTKVHIQLLFHNSLLLSPSRWVFNILHGKMIGYFALLLACKHSHNTASRIFVISQKKYYQKFPPLTPLLCFHSGQHWHWYHSLCGCS